MMKRIVLSVCAAVAFVTVAMGAASDYQQVEYLGLTGKQYFTVPFKRTTENLGYSIKFRLASIETYGPHIISTGGANPGYWVVCRRDGGGGLWAVQESGSCLGLGPEYYPGGSLNASIGKDFAMAFNTNGNQRLEINGVEVAERTNIPKPATLTELQLCHHDGRLQLNGRFYGVQFFVAGEMVADYRTCYRMSDGVPGLYETFTDSFHANKGTDTAKITLGPEVGVRDDILTIAARPSDSYGACDPAYGTYLGLVAGEQRTLTASNVFTSADGTTRDTLTGWQMYVRREGGVMEPITNGTEASVVYTHPTPAAITKFEWQWQREFRVQASPGYGVEVAPEDQWVLEGATATVRATLASRKWFVKWGGDVPFANWLDNPLTLTVTKPMQITSEVVGRSYGYNRWLTTTWATIASGVKSLDNFRIVGMAGGAIIPNVVREGLFVTTNQTAEGVVHAFQLQVEADFLKCAIGEIRLTNEGLLQARATEACYAPKCAEGSFNFYGSPSGKKPGTLVTKAGGNGYGIQALQVYTAPPKRMGLYLMLK